MVNVNECNIAAQVVCRDFNSEISLIRLAMLPCKAVLVSLGITKQASLF